ncbi:MAG: PspA-associated protein PspAA [Acidimicrobiia bacterium]
MIVRILEEGQLELPADSIEELNGLDDELVTAVEKGDEAAFGAALGALLTRVRTVGTPVPADHLGPSDIFLPAADSTLEEVRSLLEDDEEGDGFLPG